MLWGWNRKMWDTNLLSLDKTLRIQEADSKAMWQRCNWMLMMAWKWNEKKKKHPPALGESQRSGERTTDQSHKRQKSERIKGNFWGIMKWGKGRLSQLVKKIRGYWAKDYQKGGGGGKLKNARVWLHLPLVNLYPPPPTTAHISTCDI